jgi:3-carboxy-cis,cis-muconate cycloisomerase
MRSESAPGLFDGVLARGAVREATSDRAWLQAMLDTEAALARAEARAGLFAPAVADEIARACRAESFDIAAIGRGEVHRGATSQDILDTAAMLVASRALVLLGADLDGAARAAARLADGHRQTLMAGRTLLQQALPITFGLKAAGWLSSLDGAAARIDELRSTGLAVQLGGAAGTLASLGTSGPAVVGFLGEELGLAVPLLPWHSARARIAELAAALGVTAGALGKAARDVTLLAQTEVGEVREGDRGHLAAAEDSAPANRRGGSSTLPHKNNPVAAVSAVACATRAPELVATLMAAMVQEHERAAGAWHAEWRPLRDLLVTVGSAAAWLRDCLERLVVDEGRMRANLAATHGLLLSERVTAVLAPHVGRLVAHDLVTEACVEAAAGSRPLAEVLAARPAITAWLSPLEITVLLDPSDYLGSTQLFIDRALRVHAARHGTAGEVGAP